MEKEKKDLPGLNAVAVEYYIKAEIFHMRGTRKNLLNALQLADNALDIIPSFDLASQLVQQLSKELGDTEQKNNYCAAHHMLSLLQEKDSEVKSINK